MDVDAYMIIATISSILNIILFFLFLRMCDDIHALREKYNPKPKNDDGFATDKDIEKWLNEEPKEKKAKK